MSLDDFQIDQQGSDGLRSHAGAAIGVRRSAPARYIGQRRPGCVVSRWQRIADVGRSRPPRAALEAASALALRAPSIAASSSAGWVTGLTTDFIGLVMSCILPLYSNSSRAGVACHSGT